MRRIHHGGAHTSQSTPHITDHVLGLTTTGTLISYGFLKDALMEAQASSSAKQTKQRTSGVQYGFVTACDKISKTEENQ